MDEILNYMIPQEGVRHSILPPEIKHNATWDYEISPEGRHFLSVCAEGNYSQFVHLYEYLPKNGALELRFKLDDAIITYPRAIRPSKLHESFSFMPDGRLIMTTHTTATAPNHPVWTPLAYYDHQWEGYPGSNILIYDPSTNKVEDMGIPVPRVSIYGGVYEATSNAYYFSDYTRGHVYKFDLSNRHVKDYGQVTEIASFRYIVGPDNNIYFSSKSGTFLRINTALDCIEDLGIQFPIYDELPNTLVHNQMTFATIGPDKKLYFCAAFGNQLLRYDFTTNTLEKLGRFTPRELFNKGEKQEGGGGERAGDQTCGISFDKYNVLWYVCGGYLVSWDILNDGEPINHGLIGSPERKCGYVPAAYIRDDVFYATDSNHQFDPPAVISIRLDVQRREKPNIKCLDPIHYMHRQNEIDGDLVEAVNDINTVWEREMRIAEDFMKENPLVFSTPKHFLTKIWKQVPIEESSVRQVWYDEDDNVNVISGNEVLHHIVLKEGKVISIDSEKEAQLWSNDAAELFTDVNLPSRPGRQYIAKASAWAELSGGRKLVGTRDGLLAIVNNGAVFSMGVCAAHGPVHQIVSTQDGSTAYGVAGDPSDIGTVFSYSDETGLTIYGRVYTNSVASVGGLGASCEPCCIALSKDDKKLAIGARDRLGCVYEYDLTEGIKPIFLD